MAFFSNTCEQSVRYTSTRGCTPFRFESAASLGTSRRPITAAIAGAGLRRSFSDCAIVSRTILVTHSDFSEKPDFSETSELQKLEFPEQRSAAHAGRPTQSVAMRLPGELRSTASLGSLADIETAALSAGTLFDRMLPLSSARREWIAMARAARAMSFIVAPSNLAAVSANKRRGISFSTEP